MGNSCSEPSAASPTGPPVAPVETPGALPVSTPPRRTRADEEEDRRLAQRARDANEQWYSDNRLGFSKFLGEAADSKGEMQLLVCTLAPAVFSATTDNFKPWCSAAGNGGSVACSMSASNVNFGASMLKNMMRLTAAISSTGDGTTQRNAPVSEGQVMNVLQFKDTWRRLLDASAVQSFKHPYLGKVAIVQPLLMNCLVARLSNEDDELERLVQYLLERGGHASVPNSLGVTPLMVCVAAVVSNLKESLPLAKRAVSMARRLVEAGANTAATLWPFGPGWSLGAHATGIFYTLEPMLQQPANSPLCALEVLNGLLVHLGITAASTSGEAAALVAELQSLLAPRTPQPRVSVVLREPLPWTQAVFNIAWALSQVTSVAGGRQRSVALERVRAESPFALPPLQFCSAAQLRALGHIPRYTTKPQGEGEQWQPTLASQLPENAVTVFLSHRWLGGNCPDDAEHTKHKQALQAAESVADLKGVPEEMVYLWIDWAVLDQDDPMPGVKALPMYISCCDFFVYLHHPEYWDRAWCLTEQYMFWKVCKGQPRHFFGPPSRGGPSRLKAEPNAGRPPEPAKGKLSCEAERVALATLAAIMADGDD